MTERRGWEELRQVAAQSSLAQLGQDVCRRYGRDFARWLDVATTPLPETMRVNPLRYDAEWTKNKLRELGGAEIEWFSQNGEAFAMPWYRGKPENDAVKSLMQALHETGRITRQEAASMLPILVAELGQGELVLDLCAAPGSKTTQAMVALAGSGLVVANEPNAKRANMLGTNTSRIGLQNLVICKHDGRHFPRCPDPGFDVVIADVPCTGTGTVRKNGGLWRRWKENSGQGMQRLQIDIAGRGARLLRPQGRMIYSTCSIDIVENEVVVAELLQEYPWLELIEINTNALDGLELFSGFNDHPALEKYTLEIRQQLSRCRRLPIGGESNTGGFFIAQFKHQGEGEFADALTYEREGDLRLRPIPSPDQHTPLPLIGDELDKLVKEWHFSNDELSFWQRGKRIFAGSVPMRDWLYATPRYGGKMRMWPGNTWHPIQVIITGLPIIEERSGTLRPKARAMPLMRKFANLETIQLNHEQFRQWLNGVGPRRSDLNLEDKHGSVIISTQSIAGEIIVPAWLGELLTPMVDANERLILELQTQNPCS